MPAKNRHHGQSTIHSTDRDCCDSGKKWKKRGKGQWAESQYEDSQWSDSKSSASTTDTKRRWSDAVDDEVDMEDDSTSVGTEHSTTYSTALHQEARKEDEKMEQVVEEQRKVLRLCTRSWIGL